MEKTSEIGYLPEGESPAKEDYYCMHCKQVDSSMFPGDRLPSHSSPASRSPPPSLPVGLATLCFILITGRKIPLYYGSSFAYLPAIASFCAAAGFYRSER